MKFLKTYQRVHLIAFNVIVRAIGVFALLIAVVAIGSAVYYQTNPTAVAGTQTGGFDPVVVSVLLAAFLFAMGTAMLVVKPYRPDFGDATWTSKSTLFQSDSQGRSWWTGEPRRKQ